jgi:D-alanine-D-alanine ligase
MNVELNLRIQQGLPNVDNERKLTDHERMTLRKTAIVLVHPDMRPGRPGAQTETDVCASLRRLGYSIDVLKCRERQDLFELERLLKTKGPYIVCNLLEEFLDEAVFDFHPVTMVEACGVRYTGCNPRGLVVARSKLLTMRIADTIGVPVPKTWRVDEIKSKSKVTYPLFIKFNREHASRGITSRNRVSNFRTLQAEVSRMRGVFDGELIAQEFVEGSEVTIGVVGNRNPIALPAWKLGLGDQRRFATERLKFSSKVRRRLGVRATLYRGKFADEMRLAARRLFASLEMSGYARFDFRTNSEGYWLIDVNPNPNLSKTEDLAYSARNYGWSYDDLIARIVGFGRAYRPLR